jgi:hypothetical protein
VGLDEGAEGGEDAGGAEGILEERGPEKGDGLRTKDLWCAGSNEVEGDGEELGGGEGLSGAAGVVEGGRVLERDDEGEEDAAAARGVDLTEVDGAEVIAEPARGGEGVADELGDAEQRGSEDAAPGQVEDLVVGARGEEAKGAVGADDPLGAGAVGLDGGGGDDGLDGRRGKLVEGGKGEGETLVLALELLGEGQREQGTAGADLGVGAVEHAGLSAGARGGRRRAGGCRGGRAG